MKALMAVFYTVFCFGIPMASPAPITLSDAPTVYAILILPLATLSPSASL